MGLPNVDVLNKTCPIWSTNEQPRNSFNSHLQWDH